MSTFAMQRLIIADVNLLGQVMEKTIREIVPTDGAPSKPMIRLVGDIFFVQCDYTYFPVQKVYQNDLKELMDILYPYYSNNLSLPFRMVVTEGMFNFEFRSYKVVISSEVLSSSGKGYFEDIWLEFDETGKLMLSEHEQWFEAGYPPSTYSELDRAKQEIQKLINRSTGNPLDFLRRRPLNKQLV